MSTFTYTPVILAGGRSRRMGTDKAWVKHKGKALILHMIELLQALGRPIHISGSVVDYQSLELPVIEDRIKGLGPLGALDAVLDHIQTDYALVVPCDCPEIQLSSLELLLSRVKGQATVVHEPERTHPLIGLYHRSCLPTIRQAIAQNELSVHHLLERLDMHYVHFEEPTEFINLNYPNQIEP